MNISTIILILLAIAIIGYVIMINLIYYLAPTIPRENFPAKRFGKNNCTRIADNPNRGKDMKPIITNLSENEVQIIVKDIIAKMPRMKIITEKEGFLHFVQITPLFRFYDDLFIKIFVKDGMTNVWLQSQSRLGLYDLLVNERRIKHIYFELKKLT
ncbi:MAG: hypothetical protein BEU00_02950 [Marine Group III euryarchaeote CG-Epi3]|jgi:uncharacterized protein (DUF1499 family)|uniref:DUF1499 domain-containing protein n=1 Tax=Marine Group III euryarchaeote CG-Epi3 TaxID=1888997 RepID=A0A1J5TR59_9ARCH|nr:MAG: hypothetical protein BEU00_02950 [Marine Group III euryarchaeote CG-Epi3]|tara:strand:- start:4663 stop:5130 length:468 start_codon:yes stop_codon:yes gene_type:complete